MTSGERVPCCVPGCRRSHKPASFPEYICATHWPLTDRKLRRVMFRARRQRDWETAARAWRKLKRQAIEAAAGL